MIQTEPLDSVEYEALPGEGLVCPARHVNIFSRIFIYFGRMTPLMQLGYKRPITENDVWKLDSRDQTRTLIKRFRKCWAKESQGPKPWLFKSFERQPRGKGFGWEAL
ncbi:uncharacterized protein J3R85_005114 [Psidium guajava]|nr:uncharacterized protein J3R85_005114 [Psidium guajava]